MSEYLYKYAVHPGFGTSGFSLAICNQSALVCACSARCSMTSVASWVSISTAVVVAISKREGVSVPDSSVHKKLAAFRRRGQLFYVRS